ncbi:MAG: HAMP domain-containing protein [Burkholderiales bacterium]|nr:HAMP domain-containing protein [Burkholderiales bacterium]
MTYLLVVCAALAGILLFLLAAGSSATTTLLARHYPLLLVLNGLLAAGLFVLVGYQLLTLRRALKARVFGSRLTLRFLAIFVAMAVIPGAIVYTVSVQFLTRSIESWFNVRVDTALESGLDLGRNALDNMLGELQRKSRTMALDLSELSPALQPVALNRLREQTGADDAVLLAGNGSVLASASREVTGLVAEPPPAYALRAARSSREYSAIEGVGERGLLLRVIVPLSAAALSDETRWLQLVQRVPAGLAESAENVQSVYADYKELALLRAGLKRIYLITLTLTLLLSLFLSIALAFVLSRRLSEPLAILAEGTEAVARGDFSRRARVTSSDELGVLTRSFNAMTEQLGQARAIAEATREQVESAKAYLENILANLSAGVLTLDREFRLQIANAGAGAILGGEELARCTGSALAGTAALDALAAEIQNGFAGSGEGSWQREIELAGRDQIILVRGSRLPEPAGCGFVVVFDDITQLIAAQRATAWGEVARRLAHEIKNPLTPIQLSAERMQARLAGRLAPEDEEALERATGTIVAQVAALKNMVDEFREYARLPAPALHALDLNALLLEVYALYEQSPVPVDLELAQGLPAVRADPAQLRQVIHNLLQNAQDALAGRPQPRIRIRTERAGERVRLCVADNGGGFSESVMKRAFEPYVTTKPKGTGLGLAMVKKIIDEHHGTVSIENRPQEGAAVTVALPLAA